MQTELDRPLLQRFLAPMDLHLPTHLAMPTAEHIPCGTHDFLVLVQLPDLSTTGRDGVA